MIGKTLALVRRSLRVESRDLRPHLFRGALAAIILFFLAMLQREVGLSSAGGLPFFISITTLNYVFVTLAGASFFASAITEEKEERTLGLLRMANVGSLSLLLGKWIPRLLAAIFLVGLQIPFTILAITMGGVQWNQVTQVFLCLLAHLFLVGNLGLFCSVVMKRTTTACGLAIVLLLGYHLLPPLLLAISYSSFRGATVTFLSRMADELHSITGIGRLEEILRVGFAEAPYQPGPHFIANLVAGSVLFGLSWLLLGPCTRNDIEMDGAGTVWTKNLFARGPRRSRRAWDAAFVWKDFLSVAGGPVGFRLRLIAYSLAIVGITLATAQYDFSEMIWEVFSLAIIWDFIGEELVRFGQQLGTIAIVVTLFMLQLEIPFATTRAFRQELSEQTWSTLVMLPRTLPEVAYPKLLGSLMSLLPCLLWLGVGTLLLLDDFLDMLGNLLRHDEGVLVIFLYLSHYLLAVHLATWLSVAYRWAIWPVAIFLAGFMVVMSIVLVASGALCLGGGPDDVMMFLWASGLLLPTVILHMHTGWKLTELAAE